MNIEKLGMPQLKLRAFLEAEFFMKGAPDASASDSCSRYDLFRRHGASLRVVALSVMAIIYRRKAMMRNLYRRVRGDRMAWPAV